MGQHSIAALRAELRTALERRERSRINAITADLLAADAPLGASWRSLAMVTAHNLEWPLAIEASRRLVLAEHDSPRARFELAVMLHRAGRLAEAREQTAALPPDMPSPGGRAYMLGTLDTMLGDLPRARTELLEAVAADPRAGHHWLALAMTGSMALYSGLGDKILAAAPQAAGMRDPGACFYARGKTLADRGEHDAAFEAFAAGAASIRPARPHDRAAMEALAGRLIAESRRADIDRLASRIAIDTSRPIIVTGNPRSGTTLVEQILVSHSAVTNGDELGLMRVVAEEAGGTTPAALDRFAGRGGDLEGLARTYLHLLDARFGAEGRIVDKTLQVSWTLGLVASLLPRAPIVWLRRDPLDNAWSCFRNFFLEGNDWSWSLEDIAHQFALEDRLFEHWTATLGDRILVVDYAGLVREPRAWIPRLLAHCGLDPEPGVFEPHRTARPVRTASVSQVREAINEKGVGAAEPYRRHLQPFIQAYAAASGR